MQIENGYIWQSTHWHEWQYDLVALTPLLTQIHYQQGLLLGKMQQIGFQISEEAQLLVLTQSVLKNSEIEGEILNPQSVRSSLARRLGLDIGTLPPTDRSVEGIVEMTLDAVENHQSPLTLERLFAWHAALFPTGYSGMSKIAVARLRDDGNGVMQVVSGRVGRQKVHFEAPPAAQLPAEMQTFLTWYNASQPLDPFIKAGIAHLWFSTLHPFEDGNGRIARAIADNLLAKAEGNGLRFYSLSAQIQQQRSAYYQILEQTQRGESSLTEWLNWFLSCVKQAIEHSAQLLGNVLHKNHCWQQWQHLSFNPRQQKVLNLLLGDFEGKLTNKKYAAIAKVSRDTALRDLTDLVEKGVLIRSESGGRSVSYAIADNLLFPSNP